MAKPGDPVTVEIFAPTDWEGRFELIAMRLSVSARELTKGQLEDLGEFVRKELVQMGFKRIPPFEPKISTRDAHRVNLWGD